MSAERPCVAIVGPTAAGKSDLALAVAERFEGEIVNYDSVQVYRYFDIGSAKLPADEQRGIPHHLLDAIEPGDPFTAGDYLKAARAVLNELRQARKLPVLVGGTGFYLSALLRGLFSDPGRDEGLRDRLRRLAEQKPAGYLKRILEKLDRASSRRIHANDTPKLTRAIEASLLGGEPMSEQWSRGQDALPGFRVLKLGLDPPREQLYEHINRRAAGMFAGGLVEEVKALLAQGAPRDAAPFASLGYKQCLTYLDARLSLDEAIEATAQATRRYAKRQLTWFRRQEPNTIWFEGFGETEAAADWARETIAGSLIWKESGGQ